MMDDKEVFRRTKYASWSVRSHTALPIHTYAYHNRCKLGRFYRGYARLCTWRISDVSTDMGYNVCRSCYITVPDYIQSLVRLYEGR